MKLLDHTKFGWQSHDGIYAPNLLVFHDTNSDYDRLLRAAWSIQIEIAEFKLEQKKALEARLEELRPEREILHQRLEELNPTRGA